MLMNILKKGNFSERYALSNGRGGSFHMLIICCSRAISCQIKNTPCMNIHCTDRGTIINAYLLLRKDSWFWLSVSGTHTPLLFQIFNSHLNVANKKRPSEKSNKSTTDYIHCFLFNTAKQTSLPTRYLAASYLEVIIITSCLHIENS